MHFHIGNVYFSDGSSEIKDFLAVSLLGGFVTVALSLGGRPSSFDLRKGRRLDDGKWHHVQIKRFKKVEE